MLAGRCGLLSSEAKTQLTPKPLWNMQAIPDSGQETVVTTKRKIEVVTRYLCAIQIKGKKRIKVERRCTSVLKWSI